MIFRKPEIKDVVIENETAINVDLDDEAKKVLHLCPQ